MLKRIKQVLFDEPTQQKPLRLWPGVIIVVLQYLLRFGIPVVMTGTTVIMVSVFGGLLGWLAIMVWWAFFSRAPRSERWGAVVLMIVALVATPLFIIHDSISTGNMGMMFFIYAFPVLSLAFVIWAVACRSLPDKPRRVLMVVTILLACSVWALFRSTGLTGAGSAIFTWRWAETAEEQLLAQAGDEPMVLLSDMETAETGAVWPGFRGPNRDSIIHGVSIETDWSAKPPIELWRRPIGPGCSSFAVKGALLYTQEQRGKNEIVACYNLKTGKPVWKHRDKARFWDSHAGAGPRSTPTLSDGRIYTFGATGILNVLNANDGTVVWSRNAATDTDVKLPTWALTSSPLVVEDVVIVAVEGMLAAYDITTGEPRWVGPNGGKGYSSPHLLTIDGVAQILLMSQAGAISVAAADGTLLWEHSWPKAERIVQPALTANGDVLISAGGGMGMRRIAVAQGPGGWTIEERWTAGGLNPNFNDFVIHKGHAYGIDFGSLACIDVEDGKRKWEGGRNAGQLVLLADQDLLLVLSEKGELSLVKADPDQFTELARIPAIKGKTWNHPVLVNDVLLVRNAQEMVAFRLSLAGD